MLNKKGEVYLTRRTSFAAAHRLHDPALNEEENRRIYGKCNNFAGHGHNYILEITLHGRVDPRTGMLINLSDLKMIVEETLIAKVDHKNLNEDVDFLKDINPTAENLVIRFWEVLAETIPAGLLYELKLVETENNFVVYRGE